MFSKTADSCASLCIEITAADIDLAQEVRALYVGTTGDVKVTTVSGNAVTFVGVPAGYLLPVSVRRVWSTGTTASDFVGLI